MPKRILCINDISCVGRCSLTVILPILATMGIEACPLPTAVLSTHTGGFGAPAVLDMRGFAHDALTHYKNIKLCFDAIYSGYYKDENALSVLLEAREQNKDAICVIDTVLGDNGKMYTGLSEGMPLAMAGACKGADIITPNTTESALLLGVDFNENPLSTKQEVIARMEQLETLGAKATVLTGVCLKDESCYNVCKRQGENTVFVRYLPQSGSYPGTGDMFASVLTGSVMQGKSLETAIDIAANFVRKSVEMANIENNKACFGVPFEQNLGIIALKENSAHD
ncbi:MAG: pyridoxamine kinase [Oscillospiraceae bacterium]